MSSCREKNRSQNEEDVIPPSEEVKVGAKTRLYLEKWCMRLRGGEMYVEGHLLDKHLALSPGIYITSRICKVLEPCRLEGSSGREYILEGALFPREAEVEGFVSIALTPMFVLDSFSHGFPPNWTSLRDNWSLYVGRQLEAQRLARDNSLLPTLALETAGRVPVSPLHLLATPHRSSSSPSVLQMVKPRTGETTVVMKRGREHIKDFRDKGMKQVHSDGLKVPSMKKQDTEGMFRTSPRLSLNVNPKTPGAMERQEDQNFLNTTAMSSSTRKRTKSSLFWHAEYTRVEAEISREKEVSFQQAKEKRKTLTKVIPKLSKKGSKKIRTYDILEAGSPNRKPSITGESNMKSSEIRETQEGQSSSNTTARSSPRKRTQISPFWHSEYKRVEAEMAREKEILSMEAKKAKKV